MEGRLSVERTAILLDCGPSAGEEASMVHFGSFCHTKLGCVLKYFDNFSSEGKKRTIYC